MKYKRLLTAIMLAMLVFVTGCSKELGTDVKNASDTEEAVQNINSLIDENTLADSAADAIDQDTDSNKPSEYESDDLNGNLDADIRLSAEEGNVREADNGAGIDSEADETYGASAETDNSKAGNPTIVWLGDSLTQGALLDENDNLAGSPPMYLAIKYGLNIEPFGYFGYNTNDIFWWYQDESRENQQIDKDKVYIFWVGSNDFVVNSTPNPDNTERVIEQVDNFITKGELDKYIVMGTTARYELRNLKDGRKMYELINEELKNHYGQHYMDVQDVVGDAGFGPDAVHLSQESYNAIAEKVYKKLIEMEYINEER